MMVMTVEDGSDEPGITDGIMKRDRALTKSGYNAFACTLVVLDSDMMADWTHGGLVVQQK